MSRRQRQMCIRDSNNGDYKTDWDVQSCESFENEFGKWSKCNPGMELPG